MSFRRSYLVKMPSDVASMPYIDILVEGPAGSPSAPVKVGAGGTTPPSGWQSGADFAGAPGGVGDGEFFEWSGKVLRVPTKFGDSAFTPLLRLGFKLGATPAASASGGACTDTVPSAQPSQSLIGAITGDFAGLSIADPTYGGVQRAVIRLVNTADTEGGIYIVNFEVETVRDADRVALGA